MRNFEAHCMPQLYSNKVQPPFICHNVTWHNAACCIASLCQLYGIYEESLGKRYLVSPIDPDRLDFSSPQPMLYGLARLISLDTMGATQHLIVTGAVQGVGYRQFLRQNAIKLGCTGWVRNRADGTVEAVINGTSNAVAQLLEKARHGPRFARVDAIAVTSAEGSFAQFEIRPTA
jgi:acylphosphatase